MIRIWHILSNLSINSRVQTTDLRTRITYQGQEPRQDGLYPEPVPIHTNNRGSRFSLLMLQCQSSMTFEGQVSDYSAPGSVPN